jgi:uncharacterized protein
MGSVIEKLSRAVDSGNVAGIERLIAADADPSALVGDSTPLQKAAINGHIAAIAALLKAGARVDGADGDRYTPLMLTARSGQAAAIDLLVAAGADMHRVELYGNTALHWASMNGRLDAARMLLEAGARLDVRNGYGKLPIDVVRCATCPLVAAAHLRHAAAPL